MSIETQIGCSVTCFKCSEGLPIRQVDNKVDKSEKQDKNNVSNLFTYNKHQTQFCKELIERGVFTVATHYCITCDNNKFPLSKLGDIEKLCLLCAISHKADNLKHELVLVATQ